MQAALRAGLTRLVEGASTAIIVWSGAPHCPSCAPSLKCDCPNCTCNAPENLRCPDCVCGASGERLTAPKPSEKEVSAWLVLAVFIGGLFFGYFAGRARTEAPEVVEGTIVQPVAASAVVEPVTTDFAAIARSQAATVRARHGGSR